MYGDGVGGERVDDDEVLGLGALDREATIAQNVVDRRE